jgi:hypothetical protein
MAWSSPTLACPHQCHPRPEAAQPPDGKGTQEIRREKSGSPLPSPALGLAMTQGERLAGMEKGALPGIVKTELRE